MQIFELSKKYPKETLKEEIEEIGKLIQYMINNPAKFRVSG